MEPVIPPPPPPPPNLMSGRKDETLDVVQIMQKTTQALFSISLLQEAGIRWDASQQPYSFFSSSPFLFHSLFFIFLFLFPFPFLFPPLPDLFFISFLLLLSGFLYSVLLLFLLSHLTLSFPPILSSPSLLSLPTFLYSSTSLHLLSSILLLLNFLFLSLLLLYSSFLI